MTELDSRLLGYPDCYGQKFAAPGLYRYRLHLGGGFDLPSEGGESYEIQVDGKSGAEGKQHHVTVSRRQERLVAEPARLEIAPGDFVTWSIDGPGPGFVVQGGGSDFRFSSAELGHESFYIHAFGLPGVYRWTDAYGSRLSGEIEVEEVRPSSQADVDRWLKALEQGNLVHIKKGEATPAHVKVAVGGSVCWAVEGESRISVKDVRMVGLGQPADGIRGDGRGRYRAEEETKKVKVRGGRDS